MGIDLIIVLSVLEHSEKNNFQTVTKNFSVLKSQGFNLECTTLWPKMFGVGDFWLETGVIIRIESHPFYPINFDNFLGDEAEKNILFTQGPIPEMLVRNFLELAV